MGAGSVRSSLQGPCCTSPDTDSYKLSLGELGYTALILWDLTKVEGVDGAFFVLDGQQASRTVQFLPVLSWTICEAVPTSVLSPAGVFVANRCRFPRAPGILLQAQGGPVPLLSFAARQAFWKLGSQQLSKLATDQGVEPAAAGLYHLVMALVLKILPDLDEATLGHIMGLRSLAAPAPILGDVPGELLEDLLGKGDAHEVEVHP